MCCHECGNIKHNSSEDLNAYFRHISALARELEAKGLALPETNLLMVMLNSLPTEYNPVCTIIESINNIA